LEKMELEIIRNTRIGLRHAILPLLLLVMLWPSSFFLVGFASAQTSSFPNIVSYRVEGAPNYNAPGNETFWNQISWTNVTLVASVSPGGGHTASVLVKSANDGFNIYVLFRWTDRQGPSFGSDSELYEASNGTLLPLTPESTANVTQLFYNSTYYYQDRVALLWFVESGSMQQSPAMELGSDGAITGGAANIWHWQAVPTDHDPRDAAFPGGYTDPVGNAIFPPGNASYAEDDYTNMTGFYVTAGSFGQDSPNLDPFADPYVVHVGSYFSDANKTWTVEMVRSFTTSQATPYRVQLKTGSSYFVAFAVWNGKEGESAHIKSVSQWYTLTISDKTPAQPTPTPLSPEGVVSPELAAVVGVGLLIVGVIIGLLSRPKGNKE
jgi:DMSO reductase family type II enzyme heme b subunit